MRNDPEAEDVVQETFLNAFKGIARFDGRSELRTWLYRIAYNAAMMRLRRRKPEFVPLPETGPAEDSALHAAAIVRLERAAGKGVGEDGIARGDGECNSGTS